MSAPSANGSRPSRDRALDVRQAVRSRPLLTVGAPLVLVALTVAFVLTVRPVYEASTSLRIDENKSSLAMLEMLSTLGGGGEVFTEMAVLRSRSLAESVVRALGLQLRLDAPARTRRSDLFASVTVDTTAPAASYGLEARGGGRFHLTGTIVHPLDQPAPFERPTSESRDYGEVQVGTPIAIEGGTITLAPEAGDEEQISFSVAPYQRTVRELQTELAVSRPEREAGVVVVRYRGTDPYLVQAIPNAIASQFLVRRQQAQSAEARGTVSFLTEQIDTLGLQLAGAEEELRGYREQNRIVSPDAEADAQVERLAGLQARRDLLLADRDALGQLLTEVRAETQVVGGVSPFRKLMSFPTLIANTASAEMLSQLVALENQRAELMSSRTATDREVRLIDDRVAALEEQLRTMAETYWRGLGEQVRTLGAALAGFEGELARIPAQQMQYARMRRRAEMLSDLYTLLQTKEKEAQIAAAVEDQSVRVIDPAIYPTEPIRPKPWLSLMVAVAVGLVVGVGGAVVAEHMDRTVRDRAELQLVTGSVVLGLIPNIPEASHGLRFRMPWLANGHGAPSRPRLVGRTAAGDPAAEAYRSLRTNINFARPASPPKALVFTSPMPGDGKSTTAANMALVLAQQGTRVLLVDADMRRGALNETFEQPAQPGLSNILVGAVRAEDAIRRIGLDQGHALDFIPGGVRPPNPAELLSSEALDRFIREMSAKYDVIVFDAPPLNLVTDAALLGAKADGLLLVARAGVTEEEPLAYAVDQIHRVRATLLGTILNGIDERRQGYYGSQGTRAHGYFERS